VTAFEKRRAAADPLNASLCVGQIGLVSGDGAAMLLSSGRRPHGESKWVRETLGITAGAMTQPFSKTAAGQSPGD
jgi:hypothetical protein